MLMPTVVRMETFLFLFVASLALLRVDAALAQVPKSLTPTAESRRRMEVRKDPKTGRTQIVNVEETVPTEAGRQRFPDRYGDLVLQRTVRNQAGNILERRATYRDAEGNEVVEQYAVPKLLPNGMTFFTATLIQDGQPVEKKLYEAPVPHDVRYQQVHEGIWLVTTPGSDDADWLVRGLTEAQIQTLPPAEIWKIARDEQNRLKSYVYRFEEVIPLKRAPKAGQPGILHTIYGILPIEVTPWVNGEAGPQETRTHYRLPEPDGIRLNSTAVTRLDPTAVADVWYLTPKRAAYATHRVALALQGFANRTLEDLRAALTNKMSWRQTYDHSAPRLPNRLRPTKVTNYVQGEPDGKPTMFYEGPDGTFYTPVGDDRTAGLWYVTPQGKDSATHLVRLDVATLPKDHLSRAVNDRRNWVEEYIPLGRLGNQLVQIRVIPYDGGVAQSPQAYTIDASPPGTVPPVPMGHGFPARGRETPSSLPRASRTPSQGSGIAPAPCSQNRT